MSSFAIGILQQSLIFSIAVMGIYISYSILKFADLSADGSFTLGASVSAILITRGMNPYISLICAMLAGFAAGMVTGLLNVKLKIQDILSSILVMVGLYSINLRIMGKANLPLFNQDSIFKDKNALLVAIIIAAICGLFFTLFYKTKLGYLLKGIGDNENMIVSLGINTGTIKIFALALSNGFIALSGGILAQYQGFSDINMGTGTMIMGLASIIIGYNILFKNVRVLNSSLMCIMGTIIYRTSIALSLKVGFNPSDLKLISSVIVIIALTIGNGKQIIKDSLKLKEVGGNNA
ncbi:ABC transporter permease [Anaerosalibacter sp. Marseille-P3206]|uniref:ABC transporter permease n=1 Tax=Anaerosalibacter sp. Marseille-P3206 TaxID=1871005 RepID=UPI0009868455|nr:ABC transporter permease [Anaerosalibacter sp. Marseille-P3206]